VRHLCALWLFVQATPPTKNPCTPFKPSKHCPWTRQLNVDNFKGFFVGILLKSLSGAVTFDFFAAVLHKGYKQVVFQFISTPMIARKMFIFDDSTTLLTSNYF